MSLDVDYFAIKMKKIFFDTLVKEKKVFLEELKNSFLVKEGIIQSLISNIKKDKYGKFTMSFLKELSYVEVELHELYNNMDNKVLLFIIGNGNVGKSTLLNALVGYEVAQTNFLPNTWKIDVYSPEVDSDYAIIKYNDGREHKIPLEKAKTLVANEEHKSKCAQQTCQKEINRILKTLKTREEREEMKTYLKEKYLYRSDIVEVIWPVKKNWLLERCHLVDTPGLNQKLEYVNQQLSVRDYYHKADGVLWLLDGTSISAANSSELYQDLDEGLNHVGGVRENIIGVINRVDLVRKNGGDEAIKRLVDDAKNIFNGKFDYIIPLSAQVAYEAVQNNIPDVLEDCGMIELQKKIRELFLVKSESLKKQAKVQGHNKLIKNTVILIDNYLDYIDIYEKEYDEKAAKLDQVAEQLFMELYKEVNSFFESYLREVRLRIDDYVDELIKGHGKEFIKEKIYQLDDLILRRNQLVSQQIQQINNNSITWKKNSVISEYKYIKEDKMGINPQISFENSCDFTLLDNLGHSTLYVGDDILTSIVNLFVKGIFFFKKDAIKNKIYQSISDECRKMLEVINKDLTIRIEYNYDLSLSILNNSFSELLFDREKIEFIRVQLLQTKKELLTEIERINVKELLL